MSDCGIMQGAFWREIASDIGWNEFVKLCVRQGILSVDILFLFMFIPLYDHG